MEVPPSMLPMLRVVRGLTGSGMLESSLMASAAATMGLGAPKSLQEWPPGPVMTISKAAAAESLGDDAGGAGAVEGDEHGDGGRSVGRAESGTGQRTSAPAAGAKAAAAR